MFVCVTVSVLAQLVTMHNCMNDCVCVCVCVYQALANMGVNVKNKSLIAKAGGIKPLVRLVESPDTPVCIEVPLCIRIVLM